MTTKKPIAIGVSDLHLSHKVPACRTDSTEEWYVTQKYYINQLREVAEHYQIPIIGAGDIFDIWNNQAELINFAIENLPFMYTIPGQHDLPYHAREAIHRSSYWSLNLAGTVYDLGSGAPTHLEEHGISLWPFPWGAEVAPPKGKKKGYFNLAVVHKYIHKRGRNFPGAPKENLVSGFAEQLKGFDAAIFGDNHKGFLAKSGKVPVSNCGGFMKRKSDEIETETPCITLIYRDGTLERSPLDTSIDTFKETQDVKLKENEFDATDFRNELSSLSHDSLDFRECVKNALSISPVSPTTERIIKESIEL